MERQDAKRIIEGLLLVSGDSVSLRRLQETLAEFAPQALRQLVSELNDEYTQAPHAFRIQEVAGGFQLVTDPQLAPWMKRGLHVPKPDWLSKAAMETLAIIAYRQPITKAEIELIRGVDGTATLETLLERQLVEVAGRKDSPGRPLFYGTTTAFLRHFGLKNLADLPKVFQPAPPPSAPAPSVSASGNAMASPTSGAEVSATAAAGAADAPRESSSAPS